MGLVKGQIVKETVVKQIKFFLTAGFLLINVLICILTLLEGNVLVFSKITIPTTHTVCELSDLQSTL